MELKSPKSHRPNYVKDKAAVPASSAAGIRTEPKRPITIIAIAI